MTDTAKGHERADPAPPKRGKLSDRRIRCRVRCEGLSCSLGPILSISSTGMRIRGRGRRRIEPDQLVSITIQFLDGQLPVKARVAWTKRVGLLGYEAGFEFRELTPEQLNELSQIAQMSMPKLLVRRGPLDDVPNH